MSNIIDKIQVSGVTYDIGGGGGIPESAFTAYTASTNSRIGEDEEVTAAALNNLNDRVTEDEEVTAAGLNALNDKFDGLRLKKLTQAEYDALTTKDQSTLYVIVD